MTERKRAPRKILTECIGCGKPPPPKDRKARRDWKARVIVLAGEPMAEATCGECFARWGWGDDLLRAS